MALRLVARRRRALGARPRGRRARLPARSHRSNPVGIWAVENNPIRAGDDLFAVRFVLDRPQAIYRFITGFNLEGVYTDERGAPAPAEIRTRLRDKRTDDPRFPAPPTLPAGWSPAPGGRATPTATAASSTRASSPSRPTARPTSSRVLARGARQRGAALQAVQGWRSASSEITQLSVLRLRRRRPGRGPARTPSSSPTRRRARAIDSFSLNSPVARAVRGRPQRPQHARPGARRGRSPASTRASRSRGRRTAERTGYGAPASATATCSATTPARRRSTTARACRGTAGRSAAGRRRALQPALLRLRRERQLHARGPRPCRARRRSPWRAATRRAARRSASSPCAT